MMKINLLKPKFILHKDIEMHERMATRKIWMTDQGEEIPYEHLHDDHLDKILNMLETRKTNRASHLQGIKEEKARRTTKLGKILYETR